MLYEAVSGLNIRQDGIYIDGTFGRGGHSRLILSKLGKQGQLLAIDRDPTAIEVAQTTIHDPRFTIIHGPFSRIAKYMAELDLLGKVNGILLDLGVSSPQLNNPERGFSFMRDGPLDMRMDPTSGYSAAEWLANTSAEYLTWVLKTFGEERFAKRIAQAIFKQNSKKTITSTRELATLIANASPFHDRHKHPATRCFQAIRMYINQELDEIKLALNSALTVLATGGRLSVISFNSLEDRLVKNFIRQHSCRPQLPDRLPLTESKIAEQYPYLCKLKKLGKIRASKREIKDNPHARSSILRLAEKLPT